MVEVFIVKGATIWPEGTLMLEDIKIWDMNIFLVLKLGKYVVIGVIP